MARDITVCNLTWGQIEMNTYLSVVKLHMTTTSTTTTKVLVQAMDSYKAKLQLEAMYGRGNIVSQPILVKWGRNDWR